MIYYCDENAKIIDESRFRLILIRCYDFTYRDSQQWWLTLFCSGSLTLYTIQTITIKRGQIDVDVLTF